MKKYKWHIISASLSAVFIYILLCSWFLFQQASAMPEGTQRPMQCQSPPNEGTDCHMPRWYFNTFTENCERNLTCNVEAYKTYLKCMTNCAL